MNITEFKKSVNGKNISVIGVGISNRPLIKYLAEAGANVTAYDKRTKDEFIKVFISKRTDTNFFV